MPTFSLGRGYISNMLSNLLPDSGEYLCLRQLFYTLMFLQKDGKHPCLNGLHLLIQLLESCHLALVPIYFGLQWAVMHLHQRGVDIDGLVPSRQKLMEVIVAIPLDMRVIVPGCCMDFSSLYWPIWLEHPQRVRVGGHVDRNILGKDVLSLVVGDEKGDISWDLVELEETGNWRHTAACLNSDRVHLPRVIEPNRACFCISHTSSTSFSSPSASVIQTHPLPLRLGWYCCGIWVIFLVAVVITNGVPDNWSDACFMGLLCMLENVAGCSSKTPHYE